jgi:hypothetical protein
VAWLSPGIDDGDCALLTSNYVALSIVNDEVRCVNAQLRQVMDARGSAAARRRAASGAEEPPVLAAELRRAVVPDEMTDAGHIVGTTVGG